MGTKMQIEFDGENAEVEMKSPPWSLREKLLKQDAENMKYAPLWKKLKTDPASVTPEEAQIGLDKLLERDRRMNEVVLGLMKSGPVKTPEDLEKMGAEDLLKLQAWVMKKLGLSMDEEKGFSKT